MTGGHKSAGKRTRYHGDVTWVGPIDRPGGRLGPNRKHPICALSEILLLILLAVLLLPYLVTPFYRTGHPVSTLMAWRWLKGAPVSRQWIDFNAISPYAAALGGGLRGRQILQPSRASTGARCRTRSTMPRMASLPAAARPSPSRWRKTCSCGRAAAWSAKALELPLAMWIDLVLPKQRILEIYLNIAELGPSGQFGAEAGSIYAFGRSAATLVARARPPCWRRSCPIRSGAAPAIPAPGCAAWPGPIWRGRARVQRCWSENRAF